MGDPRSPRGRALRLFVAVRPPREVIDELVRRADSLRQDVEARWVPAERLHITVRFCAAFVPERLGSLMGSLERLAAETAPFELGLEKMGVFPKPRKARVLWIAPVTPPRELVGLQSRVEEILRGIGEPPEDRPFRPHLTLARFREPFPDLFDWLESMGESRGRRQLRGRADRRSPSTAGLSFRVQGLRLWHSQRSGAGLRYAELGAWRLG